MQRSDLTVDSPGRLVAADGTLAFVPRAMPRTMPLDGATVRLLSDADYALGRLAGAAGRLVSPLLIGQPLLRREAILSSRIEGTFTTAEQLVLLELGVAPREPDSREAADTREVLNYVHALELGLRRLREIPISLRLVRELHEALLTGVRGERDRPGHFRDVQNYIGSAQGGMAQARYVPPPVAEMREALHRWERDLHEGADEVPTLVHLALSHYQFEDILEAVRRLPVDTKTSHLLEVLHGLQARGYRQVLVFTQFTDTLDFLREHLVGAGFSVLCFSGRGGERRDEGGRWRVVSRDEARRLFREGRADILLCTDAAAEGLNFQYCGALVNYDMPWNPMRVEQRIGRIDRLGQQFQEMRILNLHYEDTVETDVYKALRDRIQLFSMFVGKLQPILARLPRQLAETTLLAPREARDERREQLVLTIDQDVQAAHEQAFDLDAITQADLDEPVRPIAWYDLDALDALIRRPELLPPGVVATPLGDREYSYSAPGMAAPLRVTTSATYYDEHPTSLELWSPGSPLFPTNVPASSDSPPRSLSALLATDRPGPA